ncbi:MAG: class I SAM-dependent RNA methyltransferase [Bacteroidetes bacterium]|nr:class I SAM-dependent RNA methyltransferase [Bacteroidota bacterium]
MDFSVVSDVVVACPHRISPYLKEEVEALGYDIVESFKTGVRIRGSLMDCIRLNLNLRTATQVRYSLHSFRAERPDDIYNLAAKIPWEEIFSPHEKFSVQNSAEHFTLNNTMFINLRVKDAVADRFRSKGLGRPDSGSDAAGVVIHLHWRDDHAELFLDTSGSVISRHGYRRIPGKAPMQESLAAAVVMATQWDRMSPFINPMCGSGTLAIEAALIASGRKPGLIHRDYAFCHLLGYPAEFLDQEREKLKGAILEKEMPLIIASDIRNGAVEDARENARNAGVEHLIQFECADFRMSDIPPQAGVIVLNPEYGERMGELSELENTYKEIGDFFKKRCAGHKGFVFTGNLDLAKKIGLKPSRRIEFFSAQLDCRLLQFELYQGSRKVKNPAEESPSGE